MGEAVALSFLLLPDARTHLAPYLSIFLVGSLLSLLAARSLSASGPGFLLLCGSLFRLTLLLRPPDLSDDLFRYLWDGSVAQAHISPYAYAPDDPALAKISPELYRRLSHRDIRTVYPPVAQVVFRIFSVARNPVLLKAFFAAADLSVVALIWSARTPGATFGAALYAFHPLPITETAGQGHLDSLGVALLLASLSHLSKNRRVLAGVALAASFLTKYVSLAAAPPIFRRGRASLVFSFALFAAAIWLAASSPGASPLGGTRDYATRWDFNSFLYSSAAFLVESSQLPEKAKGAFLVLKEKLDHPGWTQAVFPFFYTAFFARALLGLGLAVALLVIARCVRDLEESVFACLGVLLLFAPTLHPWYLLWVLPFAAKRREPAFLFLSFCVPVSYALLYGVRGVSGSLVYLLEYVPFAILLGRTLWKSRYRSARSREVLAA